MADDTGLVARRLVVHGRVQGVFFRQTCVDRARSHGVTGWVRNDSEGTVTVHLEGTAEAVGQMVRWCRTGPRAAEVERVDVEEVAPQYGEEFDVRRA